MLEELFTIHNQVTKSIPSVFKRYIYKEIHWDSKAICVIGARGVGKTTLLLQYYYEKYKTVEKCLYISADNIAVIASGLFTIVSEYFIYGGEAIIIDEIHKYENWSMELKNIIDTYKDKQILISGSSSLDLIKGKYDLSRRIVYYELSGLSFREFIELDKKIIFPFYKLEDILKNHVNISNKITKSITILKAFNQYLDSGYYPYFTEGKKVYHKKLLNVIEKIIYEDIAITANIKKQNISVIKRILWIIATSISFTANIDKMSRELSISKEYVYNYLEYLEMAGLLTPLRNNAKGYKLSRKPEKLYFENTNLPAAINGSLKQISNKGAIRETFFINQLKKDYKINLSNMGDFLIDDKYIFEIGGKNKNFTQIADLKDSYLAVDNIEHGFKNKIPLYLFGFLY
jgi:predicted AAA+ superfamily ATPase